ncbi:hypothetical protein HanPI659440_Chr15g0592611 [Helianthus annuus]|nr:hypothetical protein HanPI659440_Chr15g0592611 [Helianthus annuus]
MESVHVLSLVYVLYSNVMNVCGECRLYESRVVITRNRARRASHKLDCTGITEYVLLVIKAYALFFCKRYILKRTFK